MKARMARRRHPGLSLCECRAARTGPCYGNVHGSPITSEINAPREGTPMTNFMTNFVCRLACAAFAVVAAAQPAAAGDIVADWATVKTPPAPELKPVTVDPKTTALL